MKRKLLSLTLALVCVLMLCSTLSFGTMAEQMPTIQAATVSAQTGSSVDMAVTIFGVSTTSGIWGADINIEYPSDVLTLEKVTNGGYFKDSEWTQGPLTPAGKYILSYTGSDANANTLTAAGTLATLSFKVADSAAPGDYTVKVSYDCGSIIRVIPAVGQGIPGMEPVECTTVNGTVSVSKKPVPATSLTLAPATLTLTAGASQTLTATVLPADTTDTVAWSSNTETVATVSNSGVVTAVAPGTAVITAKAGTKSGTCTVTVTCNHTLVPVAEQNSTCKDKGWDAYQECSKCHSLFSIGGTPLKGIPYRALSTVHSGGTATCKAKAICDVCGQAYGNLADHNYGTWIGEVGATHSGNGTKGHYHCSVCGKDFDIAHNEIPDLTISNAPHGTADTSKWLNNATEHWRICVADGCNEVIGSTKAAHTFVWKLDRAATMKQTGIKHEECTVCGFKRNESTSIPKADHIHTPEHHDPKVPNCKEEGNVEYWVCTQTECAGKYYGEETCSLILEEVVLPVDSDNHVHTEVRNAVEATCTKDGFTGDTYCTDCGEKLESSNVIRAAGHNYKDGKCTVCGASDPDFKPDIPQFGDNLLVIAFGLLVLLSGAGVAAVLILKKRTSAK